MDEGRLGHSEWRYRDSSEQYVEDITVDFFYRPHTITLLGCATAGLMLLAFSSEEQGNAFEDNAKLGVIAMVMIMLVVSLVAFPNGPFTRPHPAVWRVVMGMSVCYLLFLVFLLFQSKDDAQKLIDWLAGEEKGALKRAKEENYASECQLTWNTISSKLDRFVLAHLLGWVAKALMIRNLLLCWIMSLLWEVTEVLFAQMLPNFAECWWDALLLDVLLCNGLGIYFGMKLCNYLEMRKYRWESITTIPSVSGKIRRALLQFTPVTWTHVDWQVSTVKRYWSVTLLVLLFNINELSAFFLKHVFFVSSGNMINLHRMLLWALFGTPSLRQFYVYATNPNCKRLGTQCFIAGAVIAVELLICLKFGRGLFPDAAPAKIGLLWFVVLIFFVLIGMYLFVKHEVVVEGKAIQAKVDQVSRQPEISSLLSTLTAKGSGNGGTSRRRNSLPRSKGSPFPVSSSSKNVELERPHSSEKIVKKVRRYPFVWTLSNPSEELTRSFSDTARYRTRRRGTLDS